jgi:hypothetical protein
MPPEWERHQFKVPPVSSLFSHPKYRKIVNNFLDEICPEEQQFRPNLTGDSLESRSTAAFCFRQPTFFGGTLTLD